jgi:hypothetical protein
MAAFGLSKGKKRCPAWLTRAHNFSKVRRPTNGSIVFPNPSAETKIQDDTPLHLKKLIPLYIGAARTSLNTMAVRLSSRLHQPVTSLYNAIKFSGYALAPVVFSMLYKPYQLRAVLIGCLVAVLASAGLAWSVRPSPELN